MQLGYGRENGAELEMREDTLVKVCGFGFSNTWKLSVANDTGCIIVIKVEVTLN